VTGVRKYPIRTDLTTRDTADGLFVRITGATTSHVTYEIYLFVFLAWWRKEKWRTRENCSLAGFMVIRQHLKLPQNGPWIVKSTFRNKPSGKSLLLLSYGRDKLK